MKRLSVLFLFVALGYSVGMAQSTSGYWNNQYGAKGFLLNGAVIASCDDETAIFYNPAALGLTDEFGVALSFITPTYNRYITSGLLGDESRYEHRGLDFAPGLVATKFKPFKSNIVNMGITVFKRTDGKLEYDDRVAMPVKNGSQSKYFIGELDFRRRLIETWTGIGLSIKLHKRLSFGVSQFITWRTERSKIEFQKDLLNVQDNLLIAGWNSKFNYKTHVNGGLVTKGGISWRPGKVKLGLTYTTSMFKYYHADAFYERYDARYKANEASSLISTNNKTDVQSHKTPWSIGLGIQIPIESIEISLSSELFSSVAPFDVINDRQIPFDGTVEGAEPILTQVTASHDAVLNFALGIQQHYSENFSLFWGARTDFSPKSFFNISDELAFLSSDPDVFHVSLGGSYKYRDSRFSIGLDYGFGFKGGGRQFLDLNEVTTENLFKFSDQYITDTQVHNLSLFIIYDFNTQERN